MIASTAFGSCPNAIPPSLHIRARNINLQQIHRLQKSIAPQPHSNPPSSVHTHSPQSSCQTVSKTEYPSHRTHQYQDSAVRSHSAFRRKPPQYAASDSLATAHSATPFVTTAPSSFKSTNSLYSRAGAKRTRCRHNPDSSVPHPPGSHFVFIAFSPPRVTYSSNFRT